MPFLPTLFHGATDYFWGFALLASPWAFGFADGGAAQWVAVVFGVGAIVYSAVTDYELGLVRLAPKRLHLLLDGLGGALLAASPWLLGFADRVYLPHLLFGLFAVVASLITRTEPARPLAAAARNAANNQ